MKRKTVYGIMLTLLLIGTLILTFNIQSVEASKPLAPNGVHNISTYESRIGEQGLLFEDANLQMWVPKSFENHAAIIFDYLVAGYGNLSSIFGGHEYPYKFSIEHYPEGSPYVWGGTDARGTIRYGYSNLEDDTPEWNYYGVPHVIGYYEEMAHCYVYDFGVRGEVSVGFYETLGMMIGGETTLRAAYNPYIEALIASNYQTFNETTSYYLEHDDGPPGIPENIWLTRVLAHIFKTEVVDTYGWDTLADVFEALQDGYPLREYDRDHTWGGFLYHLGKVTTTDFHAVFGNYGLPLLTWTGEIGYEIDGVEKNGNNTYRFRVKSLDREGKQPENVKLHLYSDGSISGSPYFMSFIGGDNQTGWIYEKEVQIEIPLFKYAFSADDGAHNIFQALGKPTVKHALDASLPVHNIDTGEDFAMIQEAIDDPDTLDGHTIFVEEGIYYENVVVDKSLSLIGEGKGITIIDGQRAGTTVKVTADSTVIRGFSIRNSGTGDWGVLIKLCSNITFIENVVTKNSYGIRLDRSSNNIIAENNITTNNNNGILFDYSSNNVIRNNSIAGNLYNFGVLGWLLENFIQDIDTSNTVDGKPVYYLVNRKYERVPLDAGYVAIVNSTNITIQNLNLTNNGESVLIAYSENTTIVQNNVTISRYGIRLIHSSRSTISGNAVVYNLYGIGLTYSSNSMVTGNKITNNFYGIRLELSSENAIYHNNFINNIIQAENSNSVNVWDNGYPSGGNYWSDYSDVDRYSGPGQDVKGSDGIWDHPYSIDADNRDSYPLTEPWSTPTTHTYTLSRAIKSWNLRKGTEKKLTSQLKGALRHLDKGKESAAIHKLMSFVKKVEALRDKKLTYAQADYLISEAQRIIDIIEG